MKTDITCGAKSKVLCPSSFTAVIALAIFTVSTATVQAEDYLYITNKGTITIMEYTGPGGNVAIPSEIDGLPVASIWPWAFSNCGSLTSVTIPDSVTNIGEQAFDLCISLTNVTIGNGVVGIGDMAFQGCYSLSSVTIPNSVTSLGQYAFCGCDSLTNVIVGNGVTSIGQGTFYGCESLTNVIIGNSVTSIGPYAFFWCNSLTTITIPDSVTTIGERAFCRLNLTNVMIGNGVISIGQGAFESCCSLSSVTFPNSLTSIGNHAFDNCPSLTSINIPDCVISIGDAPFSACSSLTAITVDTSNPAYSSVDGVLFDHGQTMLIQYPAGKAGSYNIPDSVTTIGFGAFLACRSLINVTFGSKVTSIREETFRLCTSLTSITIPNSVITIGDHTFQACTSLTNVAIGNSVSSIGGYTFSECTNLGGVYFKGNAPFSFSGVFMSDNDPTIYYLPGTIGWGDTYAERPTAPWVLPYPVILSTPPHFGIQTNTFGFRISWATNASVVIEASTTLANPVWSPVSTNTLTDGWSYFSDAEWTNYPARFYRLKSQ